MFSYLTWKETKLVLLSLAIVTLKSWVAGAVPRKYKKSTKYAANVFESECRKSRVLRKFEPSHFIK